MGLMRFQVSDPAWLTDEVLDRVYMVGMEGVPWPSRCSLEGSQLVLERSVRDSGNVRVPWSLGDEEITLGTASLMERERPYQLEVELARGAINSIRNQMAAWEMAGLVVRPNIRAKLSAAGTHFAKAATSQHQAHTAAEHAQSAIALAIEVSSLLGESYTEQAMNVRRRQTPQLHSLLGVNIGRHPIPASSVAQVSSTFNTAVVPLCWGMIEEHEGQPDWNKTDRQVRWCQEQGFKVASGPLLQFDPLGIPDWAYLFEDEIDRLTSFMMQHLKRVVQRYRGKVHLWQAAGRMIFGNELSLSEEDRLRLVVQAVDTIRSIDPRTPVVVTFDSPWGERLSKEDRDLTPLHFADTLVRAELGLSGLGLEINAGYWPLGTENYTLLEYSRQLDRWSMLGLPLLVSVTRPSSNKRDPRARLESKPISPPDASLTPAMQQQWADRYMPLILSKNCVQVIVWNQLQDREQHDYPHGGLFDAEGYVKPVMSTLRALRQEYLH